jgi:hypothetical protein
MLGKHNTMYSVSITVAPTFQSSGIGRKLKEMQLRDAMARTRADGTPRYRYVTGRNRVGRTAQMTHLNRVFGAHVVSILTGQYEDPEGQAIYYRIPLGPIVADPVVKQEVLRRRALRRADEDEIVFDLASGLTKPFANGPASLRACEDQGLLFGPAVNKLTLMNYVTPGTVRALEWLGALLPELPHIYLTSSRDESIDKALRLVRCTRKGAQVAIGLEGGYYGHTAASARSLRSGRARRRTGPLHVAACSPSGDRRYGCDDRRVARSGRGGGGQGQGAGVRLRARAGAHRCRPAGRLRDRARRVAHRARPAAHRRRDHHAYLPQRQGRVPVHRDRPSARRARVVGRRPDRLPALRDEVVHRHAAHARLDVGRRRALAGPAAPLPARRTEPGHRGRIRGARCRAVLRQLRGSVRTGSSTRVRRRSRSPMRSPIAASPCAASPVAGSASSRPSIRSSRPLRPWELRFANEDPRAASRQVVSRVGPIHGELSRRVKSLAEPAYRCTTVGAFRTLDQVRVAARAHLPVLERYHAGLYAELLGIAEGAAVTPEEIVVANHYTDLRDLDPDPATWVPAPTRDGGCSRIWSRTRGPARSSRRPGHARQRSRT